MKIRALGVYGGRSNSKALSCFQLGENILFDAGNIFPQLNTSPEKIDHIFITHSHLDHVVEIPFLVDKVFTLRERPIYLYANRATIEALKVHIMNDSIWPDFANLKLPKSGLPAIEYIELKEEEEVRIGEFTIIPILAVHTVPTYGYLIKNSVCGVIYSGDTYSNPALWERIDGDPSIKSVIIDVSFPSELEDLARASKHYTPEILKRDLEHLTREDLDIYVYHFKPNFAEKITKELFNIGCKILDDGMEIEIDEQ
jgi:ribonuclease BN (tRNA processing enzyme)